MKPKPLKTQLESVQTHEYQTVMYDQLVTVRVFKTVGIPEMGLEARPQPGLQHSPTPMLYEERNIDDKAMFMGIASRTKLFR
jgi:hypothetical protein